MELANVNKIGVAKGTAVEDAVSANFKGETYEVGVYLAMSRQAQREGYPEVAETLKRIAYEEADHAARFAELNGMISESTRENIEKMLSGERGANKNKMEYGAKAKDAGVLEANDIFNESSRDEARHASMLKGLLDRYFGGK